MNGNEPGTTSPVRPSGEREESLASAQPTHPPAAPVGSGRSLIKERALSKNYEFIFFYNFFMIFSQITHILHSLAAAAHSYFEAQVKGKPGKHKTYKTKT